MAQALSSAERMETEHVRKRGTEASVAKSGSSSNYSEKRQRTNDDVL